MEELKPMSAADLKKTSSKVIKTSSGNTYRIRKLPLPSIASLLSLNLEGDLKEKLKVPGEAQKLLIAVKDIVTVCLIEPQITGQPTENSITFEDIPDFDSLEIFMQAVQFSGYTKERVAQIESFQKDVGGSGSSQPS